MHNHSNIPDDSEVDVASEEFEVENGQDNLLSIIKESTGREYQTLEEAQKGLKETYGYVGKLGSEIKQLKEQIGSPDKAQDKAQGGDPRLDKFEFRLSNQDISSDIVDEIYDIAKARGISMQTAYENSNLKRVVEGERQKASSAIESGQRIGPGRSSINIEEFSKLSLSEQKKIIEKLPEFNEPSGNYQSGKRNG